MGDDPGCGFLAGVTAVGAGSAHACAIADDGASVYCWGRNDAHQLGSWPDPQADHAVKIVFPDIDDVVDMTAEPTEPGVLAVDGTLTVTFNVEVASVPPGSIVLTASDGTPVELTMTCRDGQGTVVDCLTGPVLTVELVPDTDLTPGETYVVTVDPPGVPDPVIWAGQPIPETDSDPIIVDTVIDESSPAVKESWSKTRAADAYGGRYTYSRQVGASASYAFTGARVTWITMRGPRQGAARLSIDGVEKRVVDTFAKHRKFRVRYALRGLGHGPHVLKVDIVRRPKAPKIGRVVIDAIEYRQGGIVTRDANAKGTVYRWPQRVSSAADGGAYDASRTRGTRTSVSFAGTQIQWRTLLGPRQGNARVKVDGVVVRVVHCYRSTPVRSRTFTFGGLPPVAHKLKIFVLGTGRGPRDNVAVDGFVAG